jgi:hypothetical protein
MKLGTSKGPYIAVGILISILLSLLAEVVFMFNGKTSLFSKSISGLQYDFLLLPLFVVLGVLGGYLFWFLSIRKKP